MQAVNFGFCVPIFAGSHSAHIRTPLLDQVDLNHLRRSILEAEHLGYSSLWVADHLMLGREGFIFEGWTFLAWVAGATEKIRLGTIHLSNMLREPALTAKMTATLDVISNGRLEFFFDPGHAGTRREAEAYGFNFRDDARRVEAFEEGLRIVKSMWTSPTASFAGTHFEISDAICFPKPLQNPHPPIWIGTLGRRDSSIPGGQEDPLLRVIARHADGWNTTPASVEDCAKTLEALRPVCAQEGTDFNGMRKSLETQVLICESDQKVAELKRMIGRVNPGSTVYQDWRQAASQFLIGTPEKIIRRIEDYSSTGIDTFMLWFMDYPALDGMRAFARHVIPHFEGSRIEA